MTDDDVLKTIDTCKFKIRTVEEAHGLALFAARIFFEPGRVQEGLYELLLNAVEHGLLGIDHAMKENLIKNNLWKEEVKRRESLPENREKCVEVVVARKPEGTFAVITDPGAGFDWKEWIALDPSRRTQACGHGIARAKSMSFDSLSYNAAGNQVMVHAKHAKDMAW